MVIFRVDADDVIGVGHYTRCIKIANQLIKENEKVWFVISKDSDADMLKKNEIPFFRLAHLREETEICDEFVCWLNNNSSIRDIVLLDSYRITKEYMLKIYRIRKLVYIDDLVQFDYPANMVINYNIESSAEQYFPTEFSNKKLLIGTKFFPVGEDFKYLRKNVVSKNVKNVLITSSSTDRNEVVLRILKEIKVGDFKEIEFWILEGVYFANEYIKRLHKYGDTYLNVNFLTWTNELPRLLANMDLVICPGSTIMLESLSIGIPCISYSFADNHIAPCVFCDTNMIAPYIGDFSVKRTNNKLHSVFNQMISYKERKAVFDVFKEIIDDYGCERIVDELLRLISCI